MAKINQEEYVILKSLGSKWKWIARDGSLCVYFGKPNKHTDYWEDEELIFKKIDKNLFQFIQWEDEEPTNIQELIEEYESEGPEFEQLDKKIRELESYNDELIRDNNQLRNAMDNQEVLSQELPVIPKFVADWIEFKKKSEITYENIFQAIGELLKSRTSRAYNWVLKTDKNRDAFARAWLDGYMVEEEPKYIIDLDDEEISDGNHYLKHLEVSIDGFRILAGDPLSALLFESKEEAQLIAEYVGGRVEELEE